VKTKHSTSAQTLDTNWQAWQWRDMAYFAATGPGHLAVIEPAMTSVYQSILESNVKPSFQQQMLGCNQVMKQHHDSQHSSKSTTQ